MEIHFAPLQGFTDMVYRNAHHRIFGGIDAYYTPFVRIEKEMAVRPRDKRDVCRGSDITGRLVPQLLTSDIKEFKYLVTLFIEEGYKRIDINWGCPFPMIAKKGKGCGILSYPDKIKLILDEMKHFPEISFSVKLRLGYEDVNDAFRLLPMLHDYPLHHITLHARTGIQQYKGSPDKVAFARFYESCKIPLLYNGDVCTISDIRQINKDFPQLDGIMIGRGLIANPALGWEYKANRRMEIPELYMKVALLHREIFDAYAVRLQGEHQLLSKMKSLWEYFFPTVERKLHKRIMKSPCITDYLKAVDELLSR